jgi:hypothetical protein
LETFVQIQKLETTCKYAEELHRKKSSHNMNPLSELGMRTEAGFFIFKLSFKLE